MSHTRSGPRSLWLRKVATRPLVFEGLEVDLALRVSSAQDVCPARKKCVQRARGVSRQTHESEMGQRGKLRARKIYDPSLCFGLVGLELVGGQS